MVVQQADPARPSCEDDHTNLHSSGEDQHPTQGLPGLNVVLAHEAGHDAAPKICSKLQAASWA